MNIPAFRLKRPKYLFAAVLMGLSAALPILTASPVYAYGQVTERSITMSSSLPTATSVTYDIDFTTVSATAIRAVVIDFCSSSPIIGDDTCGLPTGFVAGTSGLATTGLSSAGTWSAAAGNGRTITVSNASATTTGETAARSITLSGFTNPTASNTTFYARILTYAATTTGYDPADTDTIGTPLDAGGVALSTSAGVSVSGTVQETLTFCVSGIDLSATTCASATDPELELGTGDPKVLSTSTPDTGTVYSQISTNAGSGATIRMKNSNSCGGLMRAGAAGCDIAPIGASPGAITGDTFGMRATSDDVDLDVTVPYASGSQYGMDASSGGENVTTTYGDEVASSAGVLDQANMSYIFAAQASNTTPAGLYTAVMTLIATGTY